MTGGRLGALFGAAALSIVLAGVPLACGGTSSRMGADVRFEGPTVIRGWTEIRASTSVGSRATVGVTLRIDGAAMGSDTTPPYAITVDGARLRPGRHRASFELVRRDGTRVRSKPVTLEVRRPASADLRVGPAGFAAVRERLARGGVTVRLAPGRYRGAEIRLGSGSRLVGAGPSTVLAPGPAPYWAGVVIDGKDTMLSDLRIDGGGAGGGHGHAVVVQSGVERLVVRRVRIDRARTVGVYAWGALADVSVQDSRITGQASADAGVVATLPESRDISVIRTRIDRFRGFGITFSQVAHENRDTGLRSVALDNVVTNIDRPGHTNGTSEGGIWSGGADASIIGNVVRRAGWDGIETVGSSHGTSIARNTVSDTPVGIYLEHSTTGSTIAHNDIRRVRTGVNVEWEYGGVGSGRNVFRDNRIVASRVGIFLDVGADDNVVHRNRIVAGEAPIVLQGSSGNRVRDNRVCGGDAAVRQQPGRWDDGRLAHPTGNLLGGNPRASSCRP